MFFVKDCSFQNICLKVKNALTIIILLNLDLDPTQAEAGLSPDLGYARAATGKRFNMLRSRLGSIIAVIRSDPYSIGSVDPDPGV